MADLKRVLTARSVAATGAGFAFATMSIIADVQVADLVPGNTGWIAVIVAALFCILASWCFAELSGMFPTSAGVRVYIQQAFNEQLAIPLSAAYIFTIVAASGAEAYVFGSVFVALIPGGPSIWFYVLFGFTIAGTLNYFGIEIASRVQNLLVTLMFLFLLVISLAALYQFGGGFDNWYNPIGDGARAKGFLTAIALSVFLFAGFEWVTALSEETKEQGVISRGMIGSILILCVVYALLNAALVSAVPKDVLMGRQMWVDGVNYGARPHVLFIKLVCGSYGALGLIGAGLLSFLASITSFNAGILTTSRFLYAMSRDKTMPRYLSRIHLEYFTPYAAILTLCLLALVSAALLTLLGGFNSFTYTVAGAEIMMYVLAALSVIKLRSKMTTRERPFRIPLYPTTAIVTAVFFSLLLIVVLVDRKPEVQTGFAILVSIIAVMVLHSMFVIPWLRAK